MIRPFPGTDPYIERPAIWPDFHDSLIACIRGALQPQLKPRYVALTQDRLFVVGPHRPIYPDVSVLRTASPPRPSSSAAAVLEVDAPAIFDLEEEEIRQPLLHIIEPAAGNRLVTAIEVLSPDNKVAGEGRKSYLQKRDEFWRGGANLVEIDLLRAGKPTVLITAEELENLRPWHYLVAVTRRAPTRQEIYPVPVQNRLPRVAVPLADDDRDVALDLQAVFNRCWDEGPYPELLQYDGSPPGTLTPEEIQWCAARLQAAGLRTAG